MSIEMIAINSKIHKNTKIRPSQIFSHSKKQHLAPLLAGEFGAAAADYPIVFVKNSETGQFKSVVVLGLNTEENLYFNESGWQAGYVPNSIQRHPFGLAGKSLDSEELAICINEKSDRVNEEEGNSLFEEDGSESEYLKHIRNLMTRNINDELATQNYIEKLVELELLSPHTLTIKNPDSNENQDISGMYSVSEEKLKTLNSEQIFELHQNGYLAAIYAHLISLSQFRNLLRLRAGK